MSSECIEPGEDDSIACHLQYLGMGSLICRAAIQKGMKDSTNEVTPADCFNCDVGKIYREVGCDAPLAKIAIYNWGRAGTKVDLQGILCKVRRRPTTLEYCRTCTLVVAETTRNIVTSTRGLFQSSSFYSAHQDLEKARQAIRDGGFDRAITHSVASLESTCRIIHEALGEELPQKKTAVDLWKSTRAILDLDSMAEADALAPLLNSLHGVVTQIGSLRNALSDAHGRGQLLPDVSQAMAELALNSAATLATFAVRQYQLKAGTRQP